jgi:hypothetical protein
LVNSPLTFSHPGPGTGSPRRCGPIEFRLSRHVGDGTAEFENPAISAGAQAQLLDGGFEKLLTVGVHHMVALEITRAYLRIGMNSPGGEAGELGGAGRVDSFANDDGGFAGILAGEFLVAQRRHFHLDVDTVEQRPRHLRAVALDLQRRADAFFLGIGKEAAGTFPRCLSAILFSRVRNRSL